MKIRLIEPEPPSLHMWSYSRYPRLGLPMIGAALVAAGHDVLIYCPQMAPIDMADVHSAELVGLSTTTSTAPAAYEIADELRARRIPTVIGGSHVTFMANEALEHADFVARGEGGEALVPELVEALRGRRELETIRGLSFTRDGRPVHNEPRERCPNLDELPVPDLSLIVGSEKLRSTPIMTSLGCPFACTFCSVTAMFGRRCRYRSPEHVIAELEAKRPRRIFFYDDNFAADRRRLKILLGLMIERDLVVPWSAQVRTDVADDAELLMLMRRSGCERLSLGLESVNQATLDGYKKAQSVDDIARAIDTLHDCGIMCHGMFVLGADSDTVDTVRDTVEFALRHRIDSLMLNILTPGPGTGQLADMNAEGRIFDGHWQLYDGQHVVFTPRQMTPHELQVEVLRGYARFYSSRRWLRQFLALRYVGLLVHSWGWWYARLWPRDRSNRAYLKRLPHLQLVASRPPPAGCTPPVSGECSSQVARRTPALRDHRVRAELERTRRSP
jgi:anaerobic magnesium-protoporphyrin IX monomethyl ester cyclase